MVTELRTAETDRRRQKREAFRKLAEKRTNAVLDKVRILGNLANRSAYDYSDADIRKIFGAIRKELRLTETTFQTAQPREFKLD